MLRRTCFPLICAALAAQGEPGAPNPLPPEEELLALLNTPIAVASKKASTIREQPGIVSLVTRQEIQNSGARDLVDILMQVPGFAFAKDVQGSVGIGIRGLWGYEGKVLLLVDGMEINDPLYGTTQLGNHFPADLIQRVEIIRGPGSAIYGGSAELAVINVITRSAEDLGGDGGAFALGLGQIQGTEGRRTGMAAVGHTFTNGRFSLTLSTLSAPRSNEAYRDSVGGGFDMARQTGMRSLFGSFSLEYLGFRLRALVDKHDLEQREHFWVDTVPVAITQSWDNYYLDLKQTFRLGETLTLTPSLQVRRQFPWGGKSDPVASDAYSFFYSNKRVDRTVAGLQLTYDPSEGLNILAGAEHYSQKGKAALAWNPYTGRYDGYFIRATGLTNIDYSGSAFYAQGLLKTPLVDVTLGARYETHSLFESSFVPRLGFTKVLDKFHFKALWSRAFRSPNLQNTAINPGLKPEKTTAVEVEAGYQITKSSFVVLNAFDTRVDRPIIYSVLAGDDAYDNGERMGSRGAEIEFREQHPRGQFTFSYSYYKNQNTRVPIYQVAGQPGSLLAFPQHKLVLNATFRLNEAWHLYGGLTYLGERYGWDYDPAAPERTDVAPGFRVAQKKFGATPLGTFVVSYRGFRPGLDLSLGVYNLFRKEFSYIEAYGYKQDTLVTGFQPPIPAQPQEYLLKVAYTF